MARRDKTPATLEAIAARLDSLHRHVESLDKSVVTLAQRIQPFDDEDLSKLQARKLPKFYSDPDPSPENIARMIYGADQHIEAIERDVQAIRSTLQNLDGEYQLRADLLPYLRKK